MEYLIREKHLILKLRLINYWGSDADDILATLSTDDERLVILDSTIQFNETVIFWGNFLALQMDMFQDSSLRWYHDG